MLQLRLALAILGVGLLALGTVRAADDLKVGDKAPKFESTSDEGKPWKSEDVVGKKVLVVYFFPADFTGGCTKQACGFRDNYEKIADKGAVVVGVSGDSAKTHALFKKEHKLPFTLLADEKGEIAKALGVPVDVKAAKAKVKIGGEDTEVERGATIKRWTVVIDKDGKVVHKAEVKDAANDSKTILEVVEKLGK